MGAHDMTLTAANIRARKGRVTASEMGALLPCGHRFTSKGEIYARLVFGIGELDPDAEDIPPSQSAEWGSILEEPILRFGCEEFGLRVRHNTTARLHKTLPIIATPDAYVPGEPALVEVKTVSWQVWNDLWVEGVPPYIMAQVQTQLLVTGRQWCHVWVLVSGSRFESFLIEADPEWQQAIEYAVWSFFKDHVTPRIPPPVIDDDWLFTIHVPSGTVPATGDLQAVGDSVSALMVGGTAVKGALEKKRAELTRLMVAAGADCVPANGWVATAKLNPTSGKTTLRFRRKERK